MVFNRAALKDRSAMHRAIREYFDSLDYLEAETPLLCPSPIPESHIELFRTDRLHTDGSLTPLFLLPSPELWLKQILAIGAPSLYQIGRCFRNGEQMDRWHRLEFTMLEWYSLEATADDNIFRMQEMLDACVSAVRVNPPSEIAGRIRRISMEQAFVEFAGFSLESDLRNSGLSEAGPADTGFKAALKNARTVLSARLSEKGLPRGGEEESADDLFHRLFLTLVEEELPKERPLVLYDWPQLVPTLARSIPDSPWAERWELYIAGVEVANCYGEENNREALEAYWTAESSLKKASGIPVETESEWPRLISDGMPACSGAAVGLDRLLALIRGDEDLQGLDLFPINDMIRR